MSNRTRYTRMKDWLFWIRIITESIKKYQWLSIPLALHGVVIKKNGKKVEGLCGGKRDRPGACDQ